MEVVKYLIDKGGNIHAADNDGDTASIHAARSGHLGVVKHLVEMCGADIHANNSEGNTALHSAAYEGHTDVVKYLVEEREADVHATNNHGQTALMEAACNWGACGGG